MRRVGDAYFTPEWAVHELLKELLIPSYTEILEPFSGELAIVKALREHYIASLTNDKDTNRPANYHLDLTIGRNWETLPRKEWIITNPPYNIADIVVPFSYDHATKGIAVLLRLSWLEPTYGRQSFLSNHPPTGLIVLPRISFTGDGKTDSVTTAWMIWNKSVVSNTGIKVVPK